MSWLLLLAPAAVIVAEADGRARRAAAARRDRHEHRVPAQRQGPRPDHGVPPRVLHPGAAIGPHPIDHDEVYYVISGSGEVTSAGKTTPIGPGMAAYFYSGDEVGIRQLGSEPLNLIISYPGRDAAR
jgi:mannose-6-phosphate isomerase-like protein (cupin superfamily)